MSEVTENSGYLTAGNTHETLAAKDRDVVAGLPSAADLDADAAEKSTQAATSSTASDTVAEESDEDPLDDENTFDVSRAEFKELQEAFLRLTVRIEKHNLGASHKI